MTKKLASLTLVEINSGQKDCKFTWNVKGFGKYNICTGDAWLKLAEYNLLYCCPLMDSSGDHMISSPARDTAWYVGTL